MGTPAIGCSRCDAPRVLALTQWSSVPPVVSFSAEVRGQGQKPDAESPSFYFLNKFSNAARASFGFKLAGVEVSFSRVTRISNSSH